MIQLSLIATDMHDLAIIMNMAHANYFIALWISVSVIGLRLLSDFIFIAIGDAHSAFLLN